MTVDVNKLFDELGRLPQVEAIALGVQEQLDEMIPNRTMMCTYI